MEIVKTVEVVPAAARTASGDSGIIDVPFGADGVLFFINCTAVSGTTPSMTVSANHVVPNDPTKNIAVITTAAISAANTQRRLGMLPGCTTVANVLQNEPCGPQVRLAWTVTGTTPSLTFDVIAVFFRT